MVSSRHATRPQASRVLGENTLRNGIASQFDLAVDCTNDVTFDVANAVCQSVGAPLTIITSPRQHSVMVEQCAPTMTLALSLNNVIAF